MPLSSPRLVFFSYYHGELALAKDDSDSWEMLFRVSLDLWEGVSAAQLQLLLCKILQQNLTINSILCLALSQETKAVQKAEATNPEATNILDCEKQPGFPKVAVRRCFFSIHSLYF